jgi:hypothetical protein
MKFSSLVCCIMQAIIRRLHPRSQFTPEEDAKLKVLVAEYNTDWTQIALGMKTRDPRQCRERWTNYLAPTIAQPRWTRRLDQQLEECVAIHGRKWRVIQEHFPGKTDICLKNRYNLLARKHSRELKLALGQPLRHRSFHGSLPSPSEPLALDGIQPPETNASDSDCGECEFDMWDRPPPDPWGAYTLDMP